MLSEFIREVRVLMKSATRIIAIILCFTVPFLLTGCPNPIHYMNSPDNFSGSTWSTENGEISFSVDYEYVTRFSGFEYNTQGEKIPVMPLEAKMFGRIVLEGAVYEFFALSMPQDYSFVLISDDLPEASEERTYSEMIDEYTLVVFDANFESEEKFTVEVCSSKIFEIGKEFTFLRSDTQ